MQPAGVLGASIPQMRCIGAEIGRRSFGYRCLRRAPSTDLPWRGEVLVSGEELSLEAPHLAGGDSSPGHGAIANNPAHYRITTQTLGVVHVLVAAKTTKDRLSEQSRHCVLAVLARERVNEFIADHAGQTKSIIEFAIGKQTSVRRDPGTVELQLQATVENQQQWTVLGFTFQIRSTH